MNIVGILLAGGRGRRFDPSGAHNKLLQPIPGHASVAHASAQSLMTALPRVVAVVPPDDGGVGDVLRAAGCDVTVCPDAGLGMGASLVHALRHSLPGAEGWIIGLADMPFVAASTIDALRIALAGGAQIAAPFHNGRRGNPVGFGLAYLPALLALEGDQGARSILESAVVTSVEVQDPGIFRDIDTPSDIDKTGTLPLDRQAETS